MNLKFIISSLYYNRKHFPTPFYILSRLQEFVVISLLTPPNSNVIMITKSTERKAMTETSSIPVAARESIIWWKMLMWIVCENHSLAVILKVDVSITVHLR